MKLKLKKWPRSTNCLIIPMGAGKAAKFSDIGEVIDLGSAEVASATMAKFPDCFEMVAEQKGQKSSKAVKSAPQNKSEEG